MSNTATCTPAERKFLDAFKDAVKSTEGGRCPWCGYDAIGPVSERLEEATVYLFQEDRSPAMEGLIDWLNSIKDGRRNHG